LCGKGRLNISITDCLACKNDFKDGIHEVLNEIHCQILNYVRLTETNFKDKVFSQEYVLIECLQTFRMLVS